MKTFEIHYKFTFNDVEEVEADSLKEAIEKFDIDSVEFDRDCERPDAEIDWEECREIRWWTLPANSVRKQEDE